jgi:hypothetical protein
MPFFLDTSGLHHNLSASKFFVNRPSRAAGQIFPKSLRLYESVVEFSRGQLSLMVSLAAAWSGRG